MRIGPHAITPKVILAPMAGVTDKPFRLLCKRLGAGLAMSEMTTSDPRFWNTEKSLRRMDHVDEPDPVGVQIAGTIPQVMADAARHNVDHGAQIIDINRSEEHTSELQSLLRTSYAVFCLQKKKKKEKKKSDIKAK